VRLDDSPVRHIPWRVLLGDLADLHSRELITGAEAAVVEDFLEYAEAYFDTLLPFNTLAVCHGSPERQRRRLRTILTEASGIQARPDRRPNIPLPGVTTVQLAYLEIRDDEVQLRLFPADTLTQAKALYSRPGAVAGLRALRRNGWHLVPGFHWGHLAEGLASMPTPMEVDDYIDLWVTEIHDTFQVRRDEWDEYWAWLVKHRVVEPEARAEFPNPLRRHRAPVRHPAAWTATAARMATRAGRATRRRARPFRGNRARRALRRARRAAGDPDSHRDQLGHSPAKPSPGDDLEAHDRQINREPDRPGPTDGTLSA
jgi:hypothetical protein